MSKELSTKVKTATKWSSATAIVAKLISPISTMVLARILTPEAFGVHITAVMVISFAEIFTDAGFQKYLIQKEFNSEDELYKSTAVAFWSNLIMSFAIWAFIAVFSPYIAHVVGNDGYGLVIAVSSVCIPLASFSSIQMALFKRKMDFKSLFQVRIVGILIPIVVTIPLAIITRSYWSLIIGMIMLNLSNAVLLTIKSEWKPRWFYSWALFKEMYSFTFWSMAEAISIWMTRYLDVFIVGSLLNQYYMGIYKTATNTVSQFMTLITTATTPVLFSALSRLQNNQVEFNNFFLKFQKTVGLLVVPAGVGIYLFSDTITSLFLGDQWTEASTFIGWWGLTSSLTIILSQYCSEVYRAKGKPKISFFSQILHIAFLVPTVLISIGYGFETLCIARSLIRFQVIILSFVFLYALTKISPLMVFKNIIASMVASLAMAAVFFLLPTSNGLFTSIIYVFICIIAYCAVILLFPKERIIMISVIKSIKKNKVHEH